MNKFANYVHLDLFYVLDYSGSFNMNIEEKKISKFRTGVGGLRKSVTFRLFFTPSLKES